MSYCVPSHRERGLIRPNSASLSESISCCVPVRPSSVAVRVAVNRWRYEADVFRLLHDLSANLRENRADERTRTAYPCSLRVCGQWLLGVARGCKSPISKGVSFLYIAVCCTVLRSQWYQIGIRTSDSYTLTAGPMARTR